MNNTNFEGTFEAGQRKPKVKGLVWEDGKERSEVSSICNWYTVFLVPVDSEKWGAGFLSIQGKTFLGEFSTIDEAKAACQDHHDELVMGLLA